MNDHRVRHFIGGDGQGWHCAVRVIDDGQPERIGKWTQDYEQAKADCQADTDALLANPNVIVDSHTDTSHQPRIHLDKPVTL